jgi:tape measure domain-containing protein
MSDAVISIEIVDKIDKTISVTIREIAQAANLANRALDKMKGSLAAVGSSSTAMSAGFGLAALRAKDLASASTGLSQSVQGVANAGRSAARALDEAEGATRRTRRTVEETSGVFTSIKEKIWDVGKTVGSLWAAFKGAQKFIEFADSYQVMINKLSVSSNGPEDAAANLERVKDIAVQTRAPLETTAQAFSRFSLAMKANGRDQEMAFRMTKTINELLATSGATAGEAGAALLQFSQALNKGKLDGDEFRTAMELMPTAMDAIAQQMGVTRSELIALAPQGKITSDIMIRAFAAVEKQADEKFGKMKMTVGQAFQNIATEATMAGSKFLATSGVSSALVFVLNSIPAAFKLVSSAVIAVTVVVTAYVAANKLAVAWTARQTVAEGVATQGKLALIAAQLTYNSALQALSAINPWVALITGLVTLIFYMNEAKSGLASITTGIDNMIRKSQGLTRVMSMNDLVKRYNEDPSSLNDAERDKARKLIEQNAAESARSDRMKALREDNQKQLDKDKRNFDSLSNDAISAGATFDVFMSKNQILAGNVLRTDAALDKYREDYNERLAEAIKLHEKEEKANRANAQAVHKLTVASEAREIVIGKIVKELDNEISRSMLLSEERERQSRFDKIEETLYSKRIALTAQETSEIKNKIAEAQRLAAVQAALDQIYNEYNGTFKTYNAGMQAAQILMDRGKLTVLQYEQAVNKQNLALQKATDPLYDWNKAYKNELDLMRIGHQYRSVENELLAERNRLIDAGYSPERAEREVNTIRNKAYELERLKKLDAERHQVFEYGQEYLRPTKEFTLRAQALQATGGGAQGFKATNVNELAAGIGVSTEATALGANANVELHREMYRKIAELRRRNLIGEQDANVLMLRARIDHQNKYLATATTFFSNFEGLQKSSNKEVSAVGKAAAIANATIQTYQAATAAYAAMAGIPVVGPALGAAAAAGAIATGMQNVSAIASQNTAGYKSGGYTGDGAVNDTAGVVHGREYVFDAQSTQRIGKKNLDKLRSGEATSGGSVELTLNVAVVSNKAEAESALKNAAGDKMIIEVIGRNAKTVKKLVQSA